MTRALIFTMLKESLIVNIEADRIVEQGDFIKIYLGSELKAIFDVGDIKGCYLTTKKEKEREQNG